MPINDFILSTLNLKSKDFLDISMIRPNDTLIIDIPLTRIYGPCTFCNPSEKKMVHLQTVQAVLFWEEPFRTWRIPSILFKATCRYNEPIYHSIFQKKMNYRDYYELLLTISPAYVLPMNRRKCFVSSIEFDAEKKLESLIDIFKENDLYCYKEFVALLKNWRTEIINSFARPYENRRQSNALAESINQKQGYSWTYQMDGPNLVSLLSTPERV